jgi:ABC-2 type transport system ATP-binding protein
MIIKTYGLTKYYGKVRGIEGLDLEVQEGEIFGFLGPNGAGKTTTIRLLLDLIHPSRGRAEIFGLDTRRYSWQIRQRIGNVPGDVFLYEGMTGDELLSLLGRFHQDDYEKRKGELAERLEIDLGRKIKGYSRGMKQKVAIIQALMNAPELLILDEPTSGLDPIMQREVYEILLEEKERGKAVFLSSHILPEVERVCDRVGIVREGHLVDIETVSDLKRKKVRKMELTLKQEAAPEALAMDGVEVVRTDGRRIELAVHGHVDKLIKRLGELEVEDVVFPEATLEDTFMKFYSHESHEVAK